MKSSRLGLFARTLNLPVGGASAVAPAVSGGELSDLLPDIVVVLDVPALTVTQLPNAETVAYSLLESNNADLSSPISTTAMGTQTGSGGVGAPAATFGTRLKYAGGKFFGCKAVASASAAASAASATQSIASL